MDTFFSVVDKVLMYAVEFAENLVESSLTVADTDSDTPSDSVDSRRVEVSRPVYEAVGFVVVILTLFVLIYVIVILVYVLPFVLFVAWLHMILILFLQYVAFPSLATALYSIGISGVLTAFFFTAVFVVTWVFHVLWKHISNV